MRVNSPVQRSLRSFQAAGGEAVLSVAHQGKSVKARLSSCNTCESVKTRVSIIRYGYSKLLRGTTNAGWRHLVNNNSFRLQILVTCPNNMAIEANTHDFEFGGCAGSVI